MHPRAGCGTGQEVATTDPPSCAPTLAALKCALDVYEDDNPDLAPTYCPTWSRRPRTADRPTWPQPRSGGSPSGRPRPRPRWRSGCSPGPGRCSRATPTRSSSTTRPSSTWGSAGLDPSSAAPIWCTANGCAASAAAATHASSCAPRLRCSPRWVRRRSPNGPGSSCWPLGNGPASGPPGPKSSSRRRRRRSPGWSATGQQPGHRRAAVPQPLHRRLPPAEGVPEARRGLPHAARTHDGRQSLVSHGTRHRMTG